MDFQSPDRSPEVHFTRNSNFVDLEISAAEIGDGADDEPPPSQNATKEAISACLGDKTYANAVMCDPVFADRERCQSPGGSSSGRSMNNNNENLTPPASPSPSDCTGVSTAQGIGRLSLENERRGIGTGSRGRGRGSTRPNGSSHGKRTASSELNNQRNRKSADWQRSREDQGTLKGTPGPNRHDRGRGNKAKTKGRPHQEVAGSNRTLDRKTNQSSQGNFQPDRRNSGQPVASTTPTHKDSGYVSAPASRKSTAQVCTSQTVGTGIHPASNRPLPPVSEKPCHPTSPNDGQVIAGMAVSEEYPGLYMQPISSHISKEQLAAEVKGIYAGLTMVEAKCINVDDAQDKSPNTHLEPDQWQALIAVHRTLLYEHHDFLMATQHPSATEALRGFASKYNMPARMWKHGIHAFLEVLRQRRPASQDYMLAFIYLAYQMIALFYETVPTFRDTWIECLGDLARYRMAVEEEREAHVTWGGVAARWYRKAADRNPDTGRLNHHLGILERPSLRKLFLYAKSLTCVIPFVNARDSLTTLCGPIVLEEGNGQNNYATEPRILVFYAFLYSAPDDESILKIAEDALIRLETTPTSKIRDFGVELVVSGVAFVLELASPDNHLWQLFTRAANKAAQTSRPSNVASPGSSLALLGSQTSSSLDSSPETPLVYHFLYRSFNAVIRHPRDRHSLQDVLPMVHAMLAWLFGAYHVWSENNDSGVCHTFSSLFHLKELAWGEISAFMNTLSQFEPMSARTVELARQGTFPIPERPEDARPLSEDYALRGLVWTKFYFPKEWFGEPEEDDGRSIETAKTHRLRVERVQWLFAYLSFRIGHVMLDASTRSFYTPAYPIPTYADVLNSKTMSGQQEATSKVSETPSWPSTTISEHSDSEGYTVLTSTKTKPKRPSKESSPRVSKRRENNANVNIVDEDIMQWEYAGLC